MAQPADPRRSALEIGLAFSAFRDAKQLAAAAVAGCCEVLDVESVAVLLFDRERDELCFPYVAEPNPIIADRLAGIRFPAGRGIAGAVLRSGEPLCINDVSADARFLGAVDALTGRTTRALLCVPLIWQNTTLGVIEAVNPRRSQGFLDEDVALLQMLAGQLAGALAAADRPQPSADGQPETKADDSVFRREGDFWTIMFHGRTFRTKHSKGLTYLAHLLRHPGREFHACELVNLAHGDGAVGGGATADTGPVLDRQARQAYQERIADLREQLDTAQQCNDLGRVARAQHELHALTEELRLAAGLGRTRRTGSAAERARVNVTRTIAAAVNRIDAYGPGLATHLTRSIKTGTFCSYVPAGQNGRWQF